jgi:hypothetical protein
MLGLDGIEGTHDWRGPVADRMLISSADGGGAINDAVRVTYRLVDVGRRLAGLPASPPPKNGAQFHFSLPGAMQGFRPDGRASAVLDIVNEPFEQGRALTLHYANLGLEPHAALTPTFASPDVTRMRTYDLMATPLIYPGQTLSARVIADERNRSGVQVALRLLVYGRDDELTAMDGEPAVLKPGAETSLRWRLPDTGGEPIQSIGLALASTGGYEDGAVVLDYLRWDGPPNVRLRRPDESGDFWRRAWVNGVSFLSRNFPQAFRISQDRGEGMIVHGGRQWTDYRVETALTVHLAQYAGVGIRVQGLRRYYAALLVRPDLFRLVRVHDDSVAILAETPFEWLFESRYEFTAEVVGRTIAVSAAGAALVAHDDDPRALENGGVALIINEGACSCDEVHVSPPTPR